MKFILPLILLIASVVCAMAEDATVKPGMKLSRVKALLEGKGIEVSTRYQLSIASSDSDTGLQFCNLDDNITLVLGYIKETGIVDSLGIYFIPDNRTSKTQVVVREASSIHILGSGEIAIRFKPKRSEPTTTN